jgi:hypothetical protein
MPFYCVAANCKNKASLKDGTSLHTIPFYNDERPDAKRRRKIWVDFISTKRLFVPSKTSTICSEHFKPEDYERRFFSLPGLSKHNYPKLKTDELGICVFPTIHALSPKDVPRTQEQSARNKRMVSGDNVYFALDTFNIHKCLFNIKLIYVFNEVEYVGKRQIVKIEQLATKQDNNNLKTHFCGIYFGQRSARKQFRPNCLEALANLSFI